MKTFISEYWGFIVIGLFIGCLIILSLFIQATNLEKNHTGKFYQISYSDFKGSYFELTDTVYRQDRECVTFRNLITNQQQTVCAQTISVTKYQ